MFTSFDAASGAGSGADEFASAASPSPFVGRIETVAGACTLSSGDDTAITLKVGDAVRQNDIIATAPDGRASIRFIDGTSFTVSDDARVVVKEFVCGGASPSARFDVVSGTFAFIAGDIAKAGKFEIDTAVASIRGRARTGGIGMLTLTALMFAIMEEARADSPGQAFLDDGTITYNGVFEVITKEAVPKHYVVDNPAESLVLQRIGSSVNADQMINSAQIMDQLHAAQQEALHIFSLGLAQGPTTTGPGGSGDPPLSGPPIFFQPINFTSPPSGGPPTGPSGPPNPGPPPIPTPLFLDVIFTPPPAAPGKINEITGHTGDAAPDTTSSSLGLFSGPATVGTPTFVWSGGPLTSGDQT
ncbi:MAG TPA: hypothetical protein VFX03_04305, partial [Thermomicrobiales bacterium]|nr:hypothetical protein [Thermomicrobiales bacterium]